MNDAALPFLRCPVCGEGLTAAQRSLRCPRGHGFDIARQGYVNLTVGRMPHTGDTAEMVAARADFLAAGHYDLVTHALADAARQAPAGLVLDAGTGTGWHLAGVLDAVPQAVGLGLDVSKPALRRAARAHPRAGAALADLWRPLADDSAAVLLNVFAPRNGAEFHRVLRSDGMLLVATPAADHLGELVTALGLLRVDPGKADRVAGTLGGWFAPAGARTHRRRLSLTHAEVRTLAGMGPSAWHADPARLDAGIAALPAPVTVTAAVDITVHLPR
jgi:23S rRNA (guanine745-N1)-methyltransferase